MVLKRIDNFVSCWCTYGVSCLEVVGWPSDPGHCLNTTTYSILLLLGFLLLFPHDQYLLKLVFIYLITFRQLAIRQHLVSFLMVLVGLVFM